VLSRPEKEMDEFGEALWRRLVEKKFLRNEEKKKLVFKVLHCIHTFVNQGANATIFEIFSPQM
jgi:hypothetical protein